MKPYLLIVICFSLLFSVRLQEEGTEEKPNEDSSTLAEDLKTALNDLGYGEKEVLTKQEYSQVLTKYMMRGLTNNDFDYVKVADRVVTRLIETVPEAVEVSKMDQYLSTELMTEIVGEILREEFDLEGIGKETDL